MNEFIEEICQHGNIGHKVLESYGGFLIYVVRTYNFIPAWDLPDPQLLAGQEGHRRLR
jgi:hypothetical protein